jgi:hypothetical protein
MGGYGSGRPGSGRARTEWCRSLDANKLHRAGCLVPGYSGGWQWMDQGEHVAWIGLRAEADGLTLSYRYRVAGGEWQDVDEWVPLVRVPCRFGGSRPYFTCPGVVNSVACRRRAVKLYSLGQYFLCRSCYRLAYACQCEVPEDRAIRRAKKLRVRLGGESDRWSSLPDRPKGMWQRTYTRLCRSAAEAELSADREFVIRVGRFLGRWG